MNEITETFPGKWILIAGPRSVRHTVLTFIARLAEQGRVSVLDGGNQFNAYEIARALRGRTELIERIRIARMFTCYQVLASLEKTPTTPDSFIILDMLRTFYDEAVHFGERRRLLERCLPQLTRLNSLAGVLVSVHPPSQASPQADALFAILRAAAPESRLQELPPPAPLPMRLF